MFPDDTFMFWIFRVKTWCFIEKRHVFSVFFFFDSLWTPLKEAPSGSPKNQKHICLEVAALKTSCWGGIAPFISDMAGSFSWQSSYLGFGWSLQCLGWATSHWQHVPWNDDGFFGAVPGGGRFFGGKINFTKTRPPLEVVFFQGVPLVRWLDLFLLVISLRIGIPWDENHHEKPPFKGEWWFTFSKPPNKQLQAKNAMFPHQTSPSKSKCYALFFRSISTGGGNFREMLC